MIGARGPARLGEPPCQRFRGLLQGHVHDGGPGREVFEGRTQHGVPILGGDRGAHQVQIGPVEASAHRTFRSNSEDPANVLEHPRCSGGGERQDALGPDDLREARQLEIIGPKIVTPLGDAMGLVDREQGDMHPGDHLPEPLVVEPLGGDVEQSQLAVAKLRQHLAIALRVQGGVQSPRRDTSRGQGVDLVLHQGDERRDDQGNPGQQQGGQLVAEGFAAPGRKNRRRRAPRQQLLYHGLLTRSEPIMAEGLFEGGSSPFTHCKLLSLSFATLARLLLRDRPPSGQARRLRPRIAVAHGESPARVENRRSPPPRERRLPTAQDFV